MICMSYFNLNQLLQYKMLYLELDLPAESKLYEELLETTSDNLDNSSSEIENVNCTDLSGGENNILCL